LKHRCEPCLILTFCHLIRCHLFSLIWYIDFIILPIWKESCTKSLLTKRLYKKWRCLGWKCIINKSKIQKCFFHQHDAWRHLATYKTTTIDIVILMFDVYLSNTIHTCLRWMHKRENPHIHASLVALCFWENCTHAFYYGIFTSMWEFNKIFLLASIHALVIAIVHLNMFIKCMYCIKHFR
jgi:hypothetical protein